MKKMILLATVVLIVFISGCNKDDSNPLESNDINQSTNLSGQPMPDFGNDPDNNGVLATINYEMSNLLPGLPAVSTNLAFATLGDGVDAGAVTVNNNSLGKLNSAGKTYYMVPDVSSPTQVLTNINFNGTAHSWSVAGGNGIPSFNGSVNSPSNFNLSAPQQNASISKANDLVIRWSGGTNSKILILLTNIRGSSTTKYQSELADNGSYTFSTSDLSSLNGDCLLQIVKYNYSAINAGGKKYYLVSEIVKSINVNIN